MARHAGWVYATCHESELNSAARKSQELGQVESREVYVFYLQKDPFFPYRQARRSVPCFEQQIQKRDCYENVILEVDSEDD